MHVSGISGPCWDGWKPLMADWGSSGRRFKSCQPDQSSRRPAPYRRTKEPEFDTRYGYDRQPVQQPAHNPSVPMRPSTAARAVSSDVRP